MLSIAGINALIHLSCRCWRRRGNGGEKQKQNFLQNDKRLAGGENERSCSFTFSQRIDETIPGLTEKRMTSRVLLYRKILLQKDSVRLPNVRTTSLTIKLGRMRKKSNLSEKGEEETSCTDFLLRPSEQNGIDPPTNSGAAASDKNKKRRHQQAFSLN